MSETTDLAATAATPAAPNLDEDLVITFPSIAGPAGEVTSITIREPNAMQMAEWDMLSGEAAKMKAISVCAAVPLAVVQQMKARAYMQAVRRVEAFLA